MNKLAELLGINIDLYAFAITWSLIFTRVFVMLIMVPFLGGRGVPGRIRVVVGMAITTFVFSMIGIDSVNLIPEDKGLLIALYFKEIFFGIAVGMTAILCFYAIEAGGRIVDNQRGSANAQIFLPALGQVSIFGLFKYWLALGFFCYISGHTVFLKAFIEGFQVVPIYTLPDIAPGISPFLTLIIRMSADVLILGMQLASPVIIAIFLTDLVLGIANKMAPQIPVFEIGFMLKGYVGVIMVYISVLILVDQMENFFGVMQINVKKIFLLFAG
jgi:flagellar biosynthesis protein FliR